MVKMTKMVENGVEGYGLSSFVPTDRYEHISRDLIDSVYRIFVENVAKAIFKEHGEKMVAELGRFDYRKGISDKVQDALAKKIVDEFLEKGGKDVFRKGESRTS